MDRCILLIYDNLGLCVTINYVIKNGSIQNVLNLSKHLLKTNHGIAHLNVNEKLERDSKEFLVNDIKKQKIIFFFSSLKLMLFFFILETQVHIHIGIHVNIHIGIKLLLSKNIWHHHRSLEEIHKGIFIIILLWMKLHLLYRKHLVNVSIEHHLFIFINFWF